MTRSAAGLHDDEKPLVDAGGTGATAYADAVASLLELVGETYGSHESHLYMGFEVLLGTKTRSTFSRQAIPNDLGLR